MRGSPNSLPQKRRPEKRKLCHFAPSFFRAKKSGNLRFSRHARNLRKARTSGVSKNEVSFLEKRSRIAHKKKRNTKRNDTSRNFVVNKADRVRDAKRKYNNQPHVHFNTCLGRVSLRCWRDWSAVTLSGSRLISGPFSSTRTQVDCFESYVLVQNVPDGAETFAYEAHGYHPASGIPISCIGAMQR